MFRTYDFSWERETWNNDHLLHKKKYMCACGDGFSECSPTFTLLLHLFPIFNCISLGLSLYIWMCTPVIHCHIRPRPAINLRRSGMQYTWCHVWGASDGLLGRIFHCYIWKCSLRSDGCCFTYRGNTKLPWHRSRVPASTFSESTVVQIELCPTLLDTGQSGWLPPCTQGYYRRAEL